MRSHSNMFVMIVDIVISCTCNAGHDYTITLDSVAQVMLHSTLLFHVYVLLIHIHAITLDTVTQILYIQLFYVLISLLHRFTSIHALIVFVHLLYRSLLM